MATKKRRLTGAAIAFCVVAWQGVAGAQPLDLLSTWQLAVEQDPQYRAEQAAAAAGKTQAQQARSLWLPTLGASATLGRGGHKSSSQGANFSAPGMGTHNQVEFNNSITGGDLHAYEIGLKQPLISRERLAQSRQLRLASQLSDLQWQHAQQQLILKVVERYFDVLVARQTTALLEQQYSQASAAQQETQARFKVGDRPVTDSYEATAQAHTLEAQLLAARMQQQLSEAAFTDLTGTAAVNLRGLSLAEPMLQPELAPLNEWLAEVVQLNPAVLMQDKGVHIAQEEIASYSSWQGSTLDLVGRLSHEKLDGSGRYGSALNKADDWMVGVQVNVPIFTGGYRSAKRKEASYQYQQQLAQAQDLRQHVQQQTRGAWHAVQVSAQQVTALQQALQASQLRTEATHLGQQLGDKTTLEALDADNQLTSVQIDLLNAKVALVVHQLQLAALVGALDEHHLAQANQYLH